MILGVGQKIVERLKAFENIKIICAVKDVSKGRRLFGSESDRISVLPCDIGKDNARKLSSIVENADAVICCASYTPSSLPDPLGAYKVDFQGTVKLIDSCVDAKVPKFVLISSLLTNGLVAGQLLNPQYLLLNSFGGILLCKREAEKHLLSQPDIDFTVIRPGGLTERAHGNLLFGSPDTLFGGGISRESVAEVAVAACLLAEASNKIIEVVSTEKAIKVPIASGFESVPPLQASASY